MVFEGTLIQTSRVGTGAGNDVDWVGSLDTVPLAEVVKRIVLGQKSGDLQVIEGKAWKTAYFYRGIAVAVASSLESDRLGETLVETGRICRHDLALAVGMMRVNAGKLGRQLVEAGLITEHELDEQLTEQARKVIRSMFGLEAGVYTFDERPCPIPEELMLRIPSMDMLLEGVRSMTNINLITRWLPPLSATLKSTEDTPRQVLNALGLMEREVLALSRHGTTLMALVQKLGLNRPVVLRTCYGLYSANLLRSVRRPEESPIFRRYLEENDNLLSLI